MRGAILILTKYSKSPYPKPLPNTFLGPGGSIWGILGTEPFFPVRIGLLFRPKSGSVPKMPHTDPRGPNKVLGRGFGYGEFESFVRMSIAPRIGVLLPRIGQNHPSDNSPFRDQIPERSPDSNSPQNLGLTRQNLGSVGIFAPR